METHPGDTLGTRFLTFWGAIAAFFGFALFAILLQKCSSGVAQDPRDDVRSANLAEISKAGTAELEKVGLAGRGFEVLAAGVENLAKRKQTKTEVVAPNTETAAKLAADEAAAAPEGESVESKEEGEDSTDKVPAAPEPAAPEDSSPEASTPGFTAPTPLTEEPANTDS